MDEKTLRKVREKLEKALAADRVDDAIALLAQLIAAEPTSTRWAHKRGDLLRRVGRKAEAVACYEQAVDLYASQGFIARAVAMAKTVLSLDPSRVDVLSRVDPQAAQELLRQVRPASIIPGPSRGSPTLHGAATMQGRKHAAVVPDAQPVPVQGAPTAHRHPMLLDDDAPAPAVPRKHSMVLDDDDDAAPAAPRPPPLAARRTPSGPNLAVAPPTASTGSSPAIPAPKSPTGSNPKIAPPSAADRPRAAPPPPPPQAFTKPALTLDRLSLPPPREPSAQGALKPTQQGFRAPAAAAPKTPARPPPPPPRAASASVAGARPAGSGAHPATPARPVVGGSSHATVSASSAGSAPSAPKPPARISQPGVPAAHDADSAPLWADAAARSDTVQEASQPHVRPQRHATASGGGGPLPIRPYEPPLDEAELFSRALEAAVALDVAPDVAPNETRFSNAPPSPALELSEAEVSPRTEAAVDAAHDAVPHRAQDLGNLPLFPLFAGMPQDVLAEMSADIELIELRDGQYVIRRGDPGDALYGIAEGSVVIEVPGQQSLELTLSEGDVFGESCLLQDEPRHADVRVVGRLTALRIPRDALMRALRGYPQLAELLLELLTRRLLGNLLQTSLLFQEFDAQGRRELSRLFEVRRAPAGTRLAVAGKRMDGLYISLTGTLSVESPGHPERVVAPGSMFGQHTLLSQEPSPSTVTARVNLVVLRLPSAAFAQVAMQYPTVVARLAELSTGDVVSVGL